MFHWTCISHSVLMVLHFSPLKCALLIHSCISLCSTAARLVDRSQDYDIDLDPQDRSSLRQRAAPLLSDSDSKYAGKKVSRKSWKQESDGMLFPRLTLERTVLKPNNKNLRFLFCFSQLSSV